MMSGIYNNSSGNSSSNSSVVVAATIAMAIVIALAVAQLCSAVQYSTALLESNHLVSAFLSSMSWSLAKCSSSLLRRASS
jgi:hypothetical protein